MRALPVLPAPLVLLLATFMFSVPSPARATVAAAPDAESCALVAPCGDVNGSGSRTAADALEILKAGVGQPVSLACEFPENPPTAIPPKTGQTQCWNGAGATIPCAGSGQDGETRTGVEPDFIDNGDGTIRDGSTGLVWEKLDRPVPSAGIHNEARTYTWEEAFLNVADLNAANFAGHDDWRLPNIRELRTLVNFAQASPAAYGPFVANCVDDCTVETCSCTRSAAYWSSTTLLELPDYAMVLNHGTGDGLIFAKTNLAHARAVRGGAAMLLPPAARATAAAFCTMTDPCGDVNASGTVTASDALEVLRAAVGQPVTLQCRTSETPGAALVLKTGLTSCFDSSGFEVDCTGTGQDGETQIGTDPASIVLANGTISDEATGLVWERHDDSGVGQIHDKDTTYTWMEAFGKIADLNATAFAGHTDWRLPNVRELATIADFGRTPPATHSAFDTNCTGGCTLATCSCTETAYYWSSTSSTDDPALAWTVFFADGLASGSGKSIPNRVRAVRGGH